MRNLEALLAPRSVAVIGASNRPQRVGTVVMRNLLRGGFAGPVMPVNPKHAAVAGVLAYPDVASLPVAPDLAVICTPPATVPGLVRALGDAGARAAAVLTAGLSQSRDEGGRPLVERVLQEAGRHGLRVLGPNSLGLLVPGIGLNASFAHTDAQPGHLAFVSQSGAVCTTALDWARASAVGFSHFISLGDSADLDAADLLDWLGADPSVRAILLYLESIGRHGPVTPQPAGSVAQPAGSVRPARKFLSAARAAARNKPVLVVKAGRYREGARAAFSHSGALAAADDVCDAALRRAGLLRVDRIDELFDAAETLVRSRRLAGDRVAIVSNGGGVAVLATDSVVAHGGRLAELAPDTIARLDAALPPTWSRGNPVDLIGDAPGERYAAALRAVLADPGVDAVLVLHAPTAIASSEEAAAAVAMICREGRPRQPAGSVGPDLFASWLGRGDGAERARRTLRDAGIASYDTPDDAIAALSHLLAHRRNQALLLETPPSLPAEFAPRPEQARRVIGSALAAGRERLTEPESKSVLDAFGIPVVATRIARDAEEAEHLALEIGFPVALKILSPDVVHKTDVGGVALDLETRQAVRAAARAMAARLRARSASARLEGFTVQAMARRPAARELFAGLASDPVFGPVVLFGQGGIAVEQIGDRALALPPLNLNLARELVGRTHVAKLLAGYRDVPPADADALALALVQVSQIAIDLPEVVELDVNPLLAGPDGVLALDARIRIQSVAAGQADRLAIRPYPRELEESVPLRDGRRVAMRPIRPEDEPAHQSFFARLSPEDVRFRFFNLVRAIPHSQMARYTQIDYDREMAFIATQTGPDGEPETLGVVRAVSDSDGARAEFAIEVRSDLKGQGLGHALLEKMIRYCRGRGIRELVGQVLPDNRAMLELAQSLGFKSRFSPEDGAVEVRKRLE